MQRCKIVKTDLERRVIFELVFDQLAVKRISGSISIEKTFERVFKKLSNKICFTEIGH